MFYGDGVLLCHPGWSAVAQSRLTAASASASQVAGTTGIQHHTWLIFLRGLATSYSSPISVLESVSQLCMKFYVAAPLLPFPLLFSVWLLQVSQLGSVDAEMELELQMTYLQGVVMVAHACNPSTLGGQGRQIT